MNLSNGIKATALCLIILMVTSFAAASEPNEFALAGVHPVEDSGRHVFNFNVGWRFYKGSIEGPQNSEFEDSHWSVVNLPHGLEYLPDNASGSINYQGDAWYRKYFDIPQSMHGERIFLHFEGIMGKCKIWLNGSLVEEHFGGFLPIVVDVTDWVNLSGENIVSILADNSDDPTFPPGKPQSFMDFSYFGGIYRDVWLYSAGSVRITDPIRADTVAGGGVFVRYENLSEESVDVVVSTQLINETDSKQFVDLKSELMNAEGRILTGSVESVEIGAGKTVDLTHRLIVQKPHLWHPDDPYLHRVISKVTQAEKIIDSIATKIGIRTIDFRGKEGFFLNGEPFGEKLIGGNRHQDFAYIGNAMPNSLHWRDAKKLRNAGMRIIRSAHYPQDPAFMDACDELGLFVIVATPGWQFWNDDGVFEERVYSDIRNMVRRDRNHPSVIMWEPILNETHYPDHFAKRVHEIVHEEYPYPGCFTACDDKANGAEHFDVMYGWGNMNHEKSVFTREWGDNVDDWSAHNSPSRVHRSWGERAQLVQANHYENPEPEYAFPCLERFHKAPEQLVGGTLWHSFDHNRGYHPDIFLGGILDTFRQPKYSYYLFQSQRDPELLVPQIENGPMIYIANEMTPFSSENVQVFTNCDEVRLTVFGEEVVQQSIERDGVAMPSPIVEFKDVYHFMDLKKLHRGKRHEEASIVAEGLIDGKVVATATRFPAKRAHRIELKIDFDGTPLIADGSDIVVVVAQIVDEQGNVKRLTNGEIVFEVLGEGNLVGSAANGANPRKIEWGTAPALIQSTINAGTITVRARTLFDGLTSPQFGEITFESVATKVPMLFSESTSHTKGLNDEGARTRLDKSKISDSELGEVGAQQTEFESL